MPHWGRRGTQRGRVTDPPCPEEEVLEGVHGGQGDLLEAIDHSRVPGLQGLMSRGKDILEEEITHGPIVPNAAPCNCITLHTIEPGYT